VDLSYRSWDLPHALSSTVVVHKIFRLCPVVFPNSATKASLHGVLQMGVGLIASAVATCALGDDGLGSKTQSVVDFVLLQDVEQHLDGKQEFLPFVQFSTRLNGGGGGSTLKLL